MPWSCGSRPGIRQHNILASIRSLSTGNVSTSFQFRKISITPDVYFKNQIHKAAMSLFRKSTCLIAGVLIFSCDVGYCQAEISGKWLSPDGDRQIEIYENNGSYSGKIIWLRNAVGKVKLGDVVLTDITYKRNAGPRRRICQHVTNMLVSASQCQARTNSKLPER